MQSTHPRETGTRRWVVSSAEAVEDGGRPTLAGGGASRGSVTGYTRRRRSGQYFHPARRMRSSIDRGDAGGSGRPTRIDASRGSPRGSSGRASGDSGAGYTHPVISERRDGVERRRRRTGFRADHRSGIDTRRVRRRAARSASSSMGSGSLPLGSPRGFAATDGRYRPSNGPTHRRTPEPVFDTSVTL